MGADVLEVGLDVSIGAGAIVAAVVGSVIGAVAAVVGSVIGAVAAVIGGIVAAGAARIVHGGVELILEVGDGGDGLVEEVFGVSLFR
jgi:hypothetical protein